MPTIGAKGQRRLHFAADERLVETIRIRSPEWMVRRRQRLGRMAEKTYGEYFDYTIFVVSTFHHAFNGGPNVQYNAAEARQTAARLAAELAADEDAAAHPVVVAITEERRPSRRLQAKPRVNYSGM
jgi:hypothetical protein